MSIRSAILGTRPENSEPLWPRLKQIQFYLGVTDEEFARLLDLPTKVFQEHRATQNELPAFSVLLLLERLEIDHQIFRTGSLDYQLLSRRFTNLGPALPERYLVNAHGTLASAKGFIDNFLKKNDGSLSVELFRALQISPAALTSNHQAINIHFTIDIFRFLDRYSQAARFMHDFGVSSAFAPRDAGYDQALKDSRNIIEVFERVPELISTYIEKNFHYSIEQLNPESCVIRVRPHDHVDAIRNEDRAKRLTALCRAKSAFMESMPLRAGYRSYAVKKLSCYYLGDEFCRFQSDFTRPTSSLLQG